MKVSKFINLLVAVSLVTSSVASFGGNGGVHGGDPKVVRKALMFGELIESSLKKEVLAYLDWITQNPDQIGPVEMRNDLLQLIKWGLAADVQATPAYKALYDQACSATDEKTKLTIPVPASTREEAASEICFSVPLLTENRFSWEEIVALTIHEHAHHLKYSDESHALMTAVTESMKIFSGTRQNAIQNLLNSGLRSAVIESENPNDPFLILTFSADQKFVNILVCDKQSQLCQLAGSNVWLSVNRFAGDKLLTIFGASFSALVTSAGVIITGMSISAIIATGAGATIGAAVAGPVLGLVVVGFGGLFFYHTYKLHKAKAGFVSARDLSLVKMNKGAFKLFLKSISTKEAFYDGEAERNSTVVLRPSLP